MRQRPPNLWRYHEVLPIYNTANTISMSEGGTPLLKSTALGAALGLTNLYIKDERQGLLPKAPLLVLIVPGLLIMAWRRDTRVMAAAVLAVLAAFLALHGKYHYIYSRFFLPVAGLAVLPIGALLASLGSGWHHRLRYWLHPWAAGRFNPIFPAAVLVAIAALSWMIGVARPDRHSGYRLSDHIEDARLTQDRLRCDYFNNMRQKFECRGDRSHDYFWGRAVGDQCRFDGQPRTLLWLHPPATARSRLLTFDEVPAGPLALSYGLAETSRHDDVRFEVRVNGKKLALPPVPTRGQLVTHELDPGPLTEEKNSLSIKVLGRPSSWRHLCVDAVVSSP